MKTAPLAAALILACSGHAFGWGQEGHSIVAEIAQERLDADTLARLNKLLERPISLASFASWADDFRAAHPDSAGWHFVDIPHDSATYDATRDCPQEKSCAVEAIAKFKGILADCSLNKEQRVEALRFLVHFVGDIHQPLHAAEKNKDQGGNYVWVSFFGEDTNLHKVWDTGLIRHKYFSWGSYLDHLNKDWFPGRDLTGLDAGTPVKWAEDAHKIAVEVAYDLPDSHFLAKPYYDNAEPLVDQQLAVAGLRLARYVREALSPTPACP